MPLPEDLVDPLLFVEPTDPDLERAGRSHHLDIAVLPVVDQLGVRKAQLGDGGQCIEPDRRARCILAKAQDSVTRSGRAQTPRHDAPDDRERLAARGTAH
jgi:hypothetical protein